MAISRMQQPRQLLENGGILTLEDAKRMAPPGESLAYINKDEAKLLKSRGGAGEDVNGTGIKSYFIKKIFKKAKRAVKKVVKSPLGKAALLGAGAMYAGGLGPFAAAGRFGTLPGAGFLRGTGSGILQGLTSGDKGSFLGQIGNVFRIGGDPDEKFSALRLLGGGLGAAAIAAPLFMGDDEEEEIPETPFTQTPDSIASIVNMARQQDPSLRFLPQPKFVRNFYAADGGLADIPREGYESGERVSGILKLLSRLTPIGAARELGSNMDMDTLKKISMFTPVGAARKAGEGLANMDMNILKKLSMFTPVGAAVNLGKKIATMKDGGMIDMGGLEKDYREGGFVPIGEEERADDVPARLSKNEFVFTADAVRAAGGGDIDEGAKVMQNMMDNLEAGGTISEESQGMNPAQEMFNQAQMLEGRLA